MSSSRGNGKTKRPLSSFWSLVAMQFKETLSFSFKDGFARLLTRAGLYLLGIAGLSAFLWLVLYLFTITGLFAMGGAFPLLFWNVLLYLVVIVNFLSALAKVSETLYFSPDNPVLLSYPVPPNQVYFSKVFILLVRDLVRNAMTLLPLSIAIGVLYRAPIPHFLWFVFATALITALLTSTACVLSVPYYYVKRLLRNVPIIKSVLLLSLLIAVTVLLFVLVSLIPEDLHLVTDWSSVYLPNIFSFARGLEIGLGPLVFLSSFLTGYIPGDNSIRSALPGLGINTLWIGLGIVGIIALCFLTVYFLTRPFYLRMATKPTEFEKKSRKTGKDKARPTAISFFRRQLLIGLRSSEAVAGHYLLFMVTPLAVLLLNAVFNAMKKSFAGQLYTIVINTLILLLIMMATNVSMASVFSRQGKNVSSMFSEPLSLRRALVLRLVFRALFMLGSLGVTMFVYDRFSSFRFIRMEVLFFCFAFIFFGHFLWCVELDYMNPKPHLYISSSKHISINANEVVASALAFVLAIVPAALLFLFVHESVSLGVYHLLIFCALFFAARVFLFVRKVMVYRSLPFEGRGDR